MAADAHAYFDAQVHVFVGVFVFVSMVIGTRK